MYLLIVPGKGIRCWADKFPYKGCKCTYAVKVYLKTIFYLFFLQVGTEKKLN